MPESIKFLNTPLENHPKFPWPHLSLLTIYLSPVFRDKSKAHSHSRAYLADCKGVRGISSTDPSRREQRTDPQPATHCVPCWNSATMPMRSQPTDPRPWFQATPASEYDALRERTVRDVQRIRALNLLEKLQWIRRQRKARAHEGRERSRLGARRAREHYGARGPPSVHKWMEDHHYPSEDAPEETQHNYHQQLLHKTDRGSASAPMPRLFGLLGNVALSHLNGTLPKRDLETAADQLLQVASRDASLAGRTLTYLRVCEALERDICNPTGSCKWLRKGSRRQEPKPSFSLMIYIPIRNV